MIYSCPTWEYAAAADLLKLQLLQNKFLSVIGNTDMCTQIRELRMALKIPYIYDYVIKLFITLAEVG
jgi:hypothetical protein